MGGTVLVGTKQITEGVCTAKVNKLRLEMNTKMCSSHMKIQWEINKAYPGKASRPNREIRCANK
jgi:hypothetical protein